MLILVKFHDALNAKKAKHLPVSYDYEVNLDP